MSKKKAKRPAAVLTYIATMAGPRMRVVFNTNAAKVSVKYSIVTTKKVKKKLRTRTVKKTRTLRAKRGSVVLFLPKGVATASAQAKATKKLRASSWLVVTLTPPQPTPTQPTQPTQPTNPIVGADPSPSAGATIEPTQPGANPPQAPHLTVVNVATDSVWLTWPASQGPAGAILRRTGGTQAASSSSDGVPVRIEPDGIQARDTGLAPSSDYTYSLFAPDVAAPVVLTVHTAGDGGSYSIPADTKLPAAEEVLSAIPIANEDGSTGVAAALQPASGVPAVGGHMVLPPTASLPGGFIGTVTASDPATGMVSLTQSPLDAVFDSIDVSASEPLEIPEIALRSQDVQAEPSPNGGTRLNSALTGQGLVDCDLPSLRLGASPISVRFSEARADFQFTKGYRWFGPNWWDTPKAWAKVRQGVTAKVTVTMGAEAAVEITCKLLPDLMAKFRLAKTFMAGPVPIAVVLDPTLEITFGGKLDLVKWESSTRMKAGFTLEGQVGPFAPPVLAWPDLGFTEFRTGLKIPGVNSDFSGEAKASAKLVATLIAGPGAADKGAGVVAGLQGSLGVGPAVSVDLPLQDPLCGKPSIEADLDLGATARVYVDSWEKDWTVTPARFNTGYDFAPWCRPAGGTEPAHPGKPVLVGAGGQLTANWTAPTSDGGAPILGYTATAQPGNHTCTSASALNCTITGLATDTAYSVTVTATNRAGTSEPSAPTVSRSGRKILLFGVPDRSSGTTNLSEALTSGGYDVAVNPALPSDISSYDQVWWYGYSGFAALTPAEEQRLVEYVVNGGRVYLTGEWQSCSCNNANVKAIIDSLVSVPGGLQFGPDMGTERDVTHVNAQALHDADALPNVLSTYTTSALGTVPAAWISSEHFLFRDAAGNGNVLLLDESDLRGNRGRLALVMDINWAQTEYGDASQIGLIAQNLARFLHG